MPAFSLDAGELLSAFRKWVSKATCRPKRISLLIDESRPERAVLKKKKKGRSVHARSEPRTIPKIHKEIVAFGVLVSFLLFRSRVRATLATRSGLHARVRPDHNFVKAWYSSVGRRHSHKGESAVPGAAAMPFDAALRWPAGSRFGGSRVAVFLARSPAVSGERYTSSGSRARGETAGHGVRLTPRRRKATPDRGLFGGMVTDERPRADGRTLVAGVGVGQAQLGYRALVVACHGAHVTRAVRGLDYQ